MRNTSLWPAVSNVFAIASPLTLAHTHTLVCAGAPLSSKQHSGVPQMRWKIVSMCSSSNLLRCPIWHPLSGRLRWKGMQQTHRPGGEVGRWGIPATPHDHTSCLCMRALALAARRYPNVFLLRSEHQYMRVAHNKIRMCGCNGMPGMQCLQYNKLNLIINFFYVLWIQKTKLIFCLLKYL